MNMEAVNTAPAVRNRMRKPLAQKFYLCALWFLGSVFLFAAFSKILDFQQFLINLEPYGIGGHALQLLIAILVIAIEILLAVCIIAGGRPAFALLAACALLTVFGFETMMHWSALKGSQCGCFGPLSSSSPGTSLFHQGAAFVVTAGLFFTTRRHPGLTPRTKMRVWVCAFIFTMALLGGLIVQPARTNAQIEEPQGIQARALLSATCPHCRQVAGNIGSLQTAVGAPKLKVYIGAESKEEIEEFLRTTGAHLDYIPVTFRQLRSMSLQVPAIQITRNGKIIKNWIGGMPSVAEVQSAITEESKVAVKALN
jgi:uncharacterized membrane protein YphA (DoxX/SURF4 family)